MTVYYLDTSSLRSASKQLLEIKSHHSVFTGSISIIELIASVKIRPKEYVIVKSILNNIKFSEILVDWRLPYEIIDQSFGVSENLNKSMLFKIHVEEIFNLFCECSNLLEFSLTAISRNLLESYSYFCGLDEHLSKQFREVKYKDIKDSLLKNNEDFSQNDLKNTKSAIKRMKELIPEDESSIFAFACTVLQQRKSVAQLCESYNGEIDFFIKAFSLSTSRSMSEQNTPGRNDGVDLYHFLYIRSKAIFISEDVKQKELFREASEAFDANAVTLSFRDFLASHV